MWIVAQEPNQFDQLKSMPDNFIDSIVTDPPYELGFMDKAWDSSGIAYSVALWSEALRVLKPGGHLLAFGGTRTYHRMTCAIEDAGFEIRDSLHWIYGSGFPKSRDISKAIDKEAGAEREVIGVNEDTARRNPNGQGGSMRLHGFSTLTELKNAAAAGMKTPDGRDAATCLARTLETKDAMSSVTSPATQEAKQWDGWGTALKPAHEPIVMARKPLTKGLTVAANVLEYGCGGINVDDCRVGQDLITAHGGGVNIEGRKYGNGKGIPAIDAGSNPHEGRWPPNILLSDEAAEEMDKQSGQFTGVVSGMKQTSGKVTFHETLGRAPGTANNPKEFSKGTKDFGGASRFFPCFKYNAKAPKKERPVVEGIKPHATVKPVAVMRWLVRLVTPPGGTVLDMFCGSGTTAEAAELEGFNCIAIDNDPDSIAMTHKRMSKYIGEEAA